MEMYSIIAGTTARLCLVSDLKSIVADYHGTAMPRGESRSKSELRKRIKDPRLHLKAGRAVLGRELGVSAVTIAQWERGTEEPSAKISMSSWATSPASLVAGTLGTGRS